MGSGPGKVVGGGCMSATSGGDGEGGDGAGGGGGGGDGVRGQHSESFSS